MMTHKRFHMIIGALTVLVVGLAATNWYLNPDKARAWVIGMISMPAMWGIVTLVVRKNPLESFSEAGRRFFTGSVIVAGLLVAVSLGIKLTNTLGDFQQPDYLKRVWGMTLGAVLLIMGNMMPKILSPLASQPCPESKARSVQRFAGWSFVLAGLAYITVWVVMPVKQANTVATLICAASVILVLLRSTWFAYAVSRGASSTTRR